MSGSGVPYLQTIDGDRRRQTPCRWRSPDRHRDRIRHSCPTVVRKHPLPNRSRSGDPHLQRDGPDRQIRPYRLQPPVDGDRQIAIVQDLAILHYRERRTRGTGPRATATSLYFACFTSPNVVNARCAGETGPRNRRVTNVSRFPPNETSSI